MSETSEIIVCANHIITDVLISSFYRNICFYSISMKLNYVFLPCLKCYFTDNCSSRSNKYRQIYSEVNLLLKFQLVCKETMNFNFQTFDKRKMFNNVLKYLVVLPLLNISKFFVSNFITKPIKC